MPEGMTLYTFDKDAARKSMCNDKCATYWPALVAKPDDKQTGTYTVLKRDDGTMQWAKDAKPLYTFAGDKKPGDQTGDGKMDGAWHVAKP